MFSYQYGWKTSYILGLPYREIVWRWQRIVKRLNDEKRFSAAIAGIELKNENDNKVTVDDDIQQKLYEAALKDQKEWEQMKKNG